MEEQTSSEFIGAATCQTKLIDVLQELSALARCMTRGDVIFDRGVTLASNLFVTAARQTVAGGGDEARRLIASMLIDECRKLDASVGYASPVLITAVQSGVRAFCCGVTSTSADDGVGRIKASTVRVGLEDVVRAVEHCSRAVRDEQMGDVVIQSLRLGGLRGKIETKKTVGVGIDTVELTRGCSFAVGTSDAGGRWSRTDVSCLLVDGIIETVAEIDAVLEGAHAAQRPLVIVCRGCARDVIATVAHNKKRGTIDACVATVPLDVIGSNMLKDIAAVCKSDVVSAAQGRVTSAVSWQSLANVRRAVLDAGQLVIENDSQHEADVHLRQLLGAKTGTAVDDVIDRRIASLLDTRVTVTLTGDERRAQSKAEHVDMLLRSARTLLAHGRIDRSRMDDMPQCSPDVTPIIDGLTSIHGVCPAAACLLTYTRARYLIDLFTRQSAGIVCLSG